MHAPPSHIAPPDAVISIDIVETLAPADLNDLCDATDAAVEAGGGFVRHGEDLRVAIPGYEGFSRAPIDLTFDVGVRLDTVVGVFEIGFSTLLGFVQL